MNDARRDRASSRPGPCRWLRVPEVSDPFSVPHPHPSSIASETNSSWVRPPPDREPSPPSSAGAAYEAKVGASETPVRQLFGINVFSDEVMRARLPENVYKGLRKHDQEGARA